MSYDLYFMPRAGSIDPERFAAYFAGRPNFKVSLPQAWYQNDETGVYFVFQVKQETAASDEGDEEEPNHPVSLNINYFRPSYFILEAEPEITAFVRAFDLLVSDPQINGMGEGEYDRERLISGWTHGNEFGYSAILRAPGNGSDIVSLPTAALMDTWRWNLNRKTLQQELGESRFVPLVRVILRSGLPCTAAVWPDGIPIATPRVDYFFVGRRELAPRRFFRRVQDQTLLAWDNALPIIDKYRSPQFTDFYLLDYDQPPAEVRKFIESLPSDASEIKGVAADQVLNRELVEKHRG